MPRHLALLVVLILAASVTGGIGRAADGKVIVVKTEAVEVDVDVAAQRPGLTAVHALSETLRIGEHEYPLKRLRGTLTVAVAPGKPPSKRLRGEKILDLKLPAEKGSRRVRILFRNVEADVWEYTMAEARRAEIAGVELDLRDLDADGRIDTSGGDGYGWPGSTLVLPLTPEIVVGASRVEVVDLAPDASELSVRVTPIEGARDQLTALAHVNEIRGRNGLPGVVLDAALSEACTAHATYLKKNKWSGYSNPHGEIEGKPGYSAEGHRAAQQSIIMGTDHVSALDAFFATYYHRAPLIDPYLEGVGISTGTSRISVIDAKSGTRERAGDDAWNDPVLVPADGVDDVPTSFCGAGEQPEPCSNPARRGLPLMAVFARSEQLVTEFRGELVRIDDDQPEAVPTLVPASLGHPGMFGVIPERPLAGGATYRVTYRYRLDGVEETRTATFRTR